MTEPTLYVTEGEIVKRMGVGIHAGRKAIQKMREDPRFPPRDIGGKRYWPAVKAFLDLWNNLSIDAPGKPVGQEIYHAKTHYTGRPRPRLEAAKARLGRDLARQARLGEEQRVQAVQPSPQGVHEPAD